MEKKYDESLLTQEDSYVPEQNQSIGNGSHPSEQFRPGASVSSVNSLDTSVNVDKWDATLHLNKTHSLVVNRFDHKRPQADEHYFTQNSAKWDDGISVVIPFFNEPSYELETTLKSLYISQQHLRKKDKKWSKKPFNICLIQDGWHKASDSMKLYLKKLFPAREVTKSDTIHTIHNDNDNEDAHFTDLYDEFDSKKYNKDRDGSITYVIEKDATNCSFTYFSFNMYRFSGARRNGSNLGVPNYSSKLELAHMDQDMKIDGGYGFVNSLENDMGRFFLRPVVLCAELEVSQEFFS